MKLFRRSLRGLPHLPSENHLARDYGLLPEKKQNSPVSENMEVGMADELGESPIQDEIARLEEEIKALRRENKELLKTVDDLARNVFGIAQFKDSDSDINFYTGFPNYQTLVACYNFLSPGENGENIVYVTSSTDDSFTPTNSEEIPGNKPGRRRKLSTLDEFFMVLIRFRGLACLSLTFLTGLKFMCQL